MEESRQPTFSPQNSKKPSFSAFGGLDSDSDSSSSEVIESGSTSSMSKYEELNTQIE
jgi:hypothetical protein